MSRKYTVEIDKDTRFRPCESGNPGGRPKVRSLSKAYRNQLEQSNPADPAQRSFAECIAEKLVQMAAKGNVQAYIELADRCEGKVKLAIGAVEEDEFSTMSVEELEAELERTRPEHSGGPDTKTPPEGGYTR